MWVFYIFFVLCSISRGFVNKKGAGEHGRAWVDRNTGMVRVGQVHGKAVIVDQSRIKPAGCPINTTNWGCQF